MSTENPFGDIGIGEHAEAARREQLAAIASMRSRQQARKGPTVFFPFGQQQPLAKYHGMKVIPTLRNPFVADPSVLLKEPEAGAHYGFVENTPRTRGLFRSGVFEPVYLEELREDNDAEITVEDVLTESGTKKLVLWHSLRLVKISQRAWRERYELPALMGPISLAQQQESFLDFSAQAYRTVREDDGTMRHESGGDFRDLRGKAELTMTVSP